MTFHIFVARGESTTENFRKVTTENVIFSFLKLLWCMSKGLMQAINVLVESFRV